MTKSNAFVNPQKTLHGGMLECEICSRWSHCTCVKISHRLASSFPFVCPYCIKSTLALIPTLRSEVSQLKAHITKLEKSCKSIPQLSSDLSSIKSSLGSISNKTQTQSTPPQTSDIMPIHKASTCTPSGSIPASSQSSTTLSTATPALVPSVSPSSAPPCLPTVHSQSLHSLKTSVSTRHGTRDTGPSPNVPQSQSELPTSNFPAPKPNKPNKPFGNHFLSHRPHPRSKPPLLPNPPILPYNVPLLSHPPTRPPPPRPNYPPPPFTHPTRHALPLPLLPLFLTFHHTPLHNYITKMSSEI